jgi:RHS repeat-associated protein
MLVAPRLSAYSENRVGSYYRARYYDPASGRFLAEDPLGFNGGPDFYAYVSNHSTDLIDPLGLLQICCRPAHLSPVAKYAEATLQPPPCHCFLRLSDGHTLGAYFSWNVGTFGALVLKRDDPTDSRKYKDEAKCSDVPGKPCVNDAKARKAFDASPKNLGTYGFGTADAGTSNDPLGGLLSDAGISSSLPSCAWGKGTGDNSTFMNRWLKLNFPLLK